MEQVHHHYTFWQWIHYHWAEISLVYFPAFLGYLNATAAFGNVMGWTKFADFLGKLERAMKAFVDNVKTQGGSNEKNNVSLNPDIAVTKPVPGPDTSK